MFTFLSKKKYQAHSLGVARRGRARLGTWTLHTQGALGGGGQFNNWSESQKRGELVSGVSRGQWGWGRGCGVQAQTQGLASTIHSSPAAGAHFWGRGDMAWLSICASVHAAPGILEDLNSEAAGPRLLVSLNLLPCVCNRGQVSSQRYFLPGVVRSPVGQGDNGLWPPPGRLYCCVLQAQHRVVTPSTGG